MSKPYQLKPEERARGDKRHAEFYLQVALETRRLYEQGGENVVKGLALFDSELAHIRAGQAYAMANGEKDDEAAQLCSKYPDAAAYVMQMRLGERDQIQWFEQAATMARKLGNKEIESSHLGNLGSAYLRLAEVRKAIEYYEQALVIAREIAKISSTEAERRAAKHSEGAWLGNLGLAYVDLGEVRQAIGYYEQALAIDSEIAKTSPSEEEQVAARRREANDLGNLGVAYNQLGEMPQAIEYIEQALAVTRVIGDKPHEGVWLYALGTAYAELGEERKAIGYYEQTLAIARAIGDMHNVENCLNGLGIICSTSGKVQKALEYLEQGLAIARELGDRSGEGAVLGNLGVAYYLSGNAGKAIECADFQIRIFEEIEHPEVKSAHNIKQSFVFGSRHKVLYLLIRLNSRWTAMLFKRMNLGMRKGKLIKFRR
jgi:tetratricopeptide (TPR) repeat protein